MEADAGLTGGCQCGAIRYRLDAAPIRANICHCRMCQKAGAAPFMAFAAVPVEKFAVTHGAIATFASSDIAERGFCSVCGTPLTYRELKSADISVTIMSLDDPNAVAPDTQLGAESQVHWLAGALALPAVRTDEWRSRKKIAAVQSRQHPDANPSEARHSK
jgi:hypothetical protein